MAVVRTFNVSSRANVINAIIALQMNDDHPDDLFISNADDGYRFSTWGGERSVVVIGHPISLDVVRVTWKELAGDGERAWDEDITTHSMLSAEALAKTIVEFICAGSWPPCCVRHRKRMPHVTTMRDDKPYGTVDVVVQINSSYETMALFSEFKEHNMSYKQDMGGYMHTIGHINDRPICVSPMIHVIDGVNVMYVEATSGLVDWDLIEEWIKGIVPEDVRIVTDPTNLLGEIRSVIRNREAATAT